MLAPYRPDFKIMSGDDNLTLPLMALGGHGVISVVSNLVPGRIKQLVLTAARGAPRAARQIHYELMPLFRGAFVENPPYSNQSYDEFVRDGSRSPKIALV